MSENENFIGSVSSILNDLLVCKNIEEELSLLEDVHQNITKFDETDNEQNKKDTHTSKISKVAQGNNLESLITYVFTRRFGWSESVQLEGTSQAILLKIGAIDIKQISKLKKDNLDRELDAMIEWLTGQPLCPALINGYMVLVSKASSLPIVRNRSIVHILSWLQLKMTPTCDATVISLVNDLLILSLTDVWSAIRKVSSSRLGVILDGFSSQHQVSLWNRLVEICEDPDNSWQKTDGAILGISSIVQHYHSTKSNTASNFQDAREVPDFLQRDLVRVVFRVISHSQLPIREAAVRAVTAYITLMDSQKCLEILEETLRHLKGDKTVDGETEDSVDAYMAEGLLNICQSLIKILPLPTLLPRMEEYLSTFLLHLAHPASSVRQSASCVFKLLVQKSCDNVSLIIRLLYTLTKGWTPNIEERITDKSEVSWQGREGRMFAFEIICTFLIKNHIRTMFNSRKQHKREDSLHTSEPSCGSPSKLLSAQSSVEVASAPTLSVIAQMRLQDHQQSDQSREMNCKQDTFESPRSRMLLTTILYQTVECFADNQWELRRIAQQVLPCLAEVVRWFDCALLQHIWETHMSSDSSLATFMSLFLLKESLYHCIRLEPLLQNTTDHTFKTADLTDSVRCILESVTRNTARYLPATDLLLARNSFDKLSVLGAEIIIMAHQLFDIDSRQKQSQSPVLNFWKRLFVFAHPSTRITRDLLGPSNVEFSSPYNGYLSCCLVEPEGDGQCARQVEKVFVKTICGHLQVYLSCLPWTDVAGYLPLLMYNVGLIIDDSHMCKTLLRCISSQSRRVVDKVLTEESSERQFSLRCVYFCLREAAGIVAMKSLDSQLLQKVLHIYLVLCQAIHPSRHLKMIFRGICVRLCKKSSAPECMDLSPRPDVDVSLLWQESPVLLNFSEGSGEEQEEEEDIFAGGDLPAFYSECLSLNVSSSSGQFLTGRPRTLSTQSSVSEEEAGGTEGEGEEEEEESDDWDSWSEEEQDDGSLNEMIAVFLTNLKQVLGQDGLTIFDEEAQRLTDEEKQIIHRLTTKCS